MPSTQTFKSRHLTVRPALRRYTQAVSPCDSDKLPLIKVRLLRAFVSLMYPPVGALTASKSSNCVRVLISAATPEGYTPVITTVLAPRRVGTSKGDGRGTGVRGRKSHSSWGTTLLGAIALILQCYYKHSYNQILVKLKIWYDIIS